MNAKPWRIDTDELESFSQNLVVNENLEVEDTQNWIDEKKADLKPLFLSFINSFLYQ